MTNTILDLPKDTREAFIEFTGDSRYVEQTWNEQIPVWSKFIRECSKIINTGAAYTHGASNILDYKLQTYIKDYYERVEDNKPEEAFTIMALAIAWMNMLKR